MTTQTTELDGHDENARSTMIEKILSVIENGDTSNDITDKIISRYPKLLSRKIEQRGSKKEGIAQMRAEVGSKTNSNEGTIFLIDRNERPCRYSLVNSDDITDDESDVVIDITKTEEELNIGYVYILDTHLDINGRRIVKIGKTNDIERRIKQLDGEQGSYQKHTIIHTFRVDRPYKVEHAIHNTLDKGRINPGKEGFYGDYVEANMDIINTIVGLFIVEEPEV